MTKSQHPIHPISYFAVSNFRGEQLPFGIKQPDRRSHMYILGKTGTGKSTLLETLLRQDLAAGRGVALIDPHGDLVQQVVAHLPADRQSDLIYFNVPDTSQVLGFNPLEPVSPAKRAVAAAGLLEVFKKLWADSWGPRLEHILRNALLALLEQSQATLADIPTLLTDAAFRKMVIARTTNPQVRQFWETEYAKYSVRFRNEAIAPIQNKVGAFLSNPILHPILTQPKSAFKLRTVMDRGQVLLVNLAKGQIGEDTAALLGALLVSRLGLAALSRADVPETERRDFYVYLDEFQNFITLSFITLLSESRKYGLNLILAHQHLAQIDPKIQAALLGNVGTMIAFRLGVLDAEIIAKEFYPVLAPEDFTNLPNHCIYLKMMIDGKMSEPFSAKTIRAENNGRKD